MKVRAVMAAKHVRRDEAVKYCSQRVRMCGVCGGEHVSRCTRNIRRPLQVVLSSEMADSKFDQEQAQLWTELKLFALSKAEIRVLKDEFILEVARSIDATLNNALL